MHAVLVHCQQPGAEAPGLHCLLPHLPALWGDAGWPHECACLPEAAHVPAAKQGECGGGCRKGHVPAANRVSWERGCRKGHTVSGHLCSMMGARQPAMEMGQVQVVNQNKCVQLYPWCWWLDTIARGLFARMNIEWVMKEYEHTCSCSTENICSTHVCPLKYNS